VNGLRNVEERLLATARTSDAEWEGVKQLGVALHKLARVHFRHLDPQEHSDIEGFDDVLFGAVSCLRKGRHPNNEQLERSLSFHRPRALIRLTSEFPEVAQLASFQLLLGSVVEVKSGILPTTSTKS